MALHRDIHWIGRQWAVTGYGMQAIDQRHGGQFDIEIERLWDDDLLERLSGQKWFNPEDFAKGLAIARKRYPGTLAPAAPEPEPEPEPESEPEFDTRTSSPNLNLRRLNQRLRRCHRPSRRQCRKASLSHRRRKLPRF